MYIYLYPITMATDSISGGNKLYFGGSEYTIIVSLLHGITFCFYQISRVQSLFLESLCLNMTTHNPYKEWSPTLACLFVCSIREILAVSCGTI